MTETMQAALIGAAIAIAGGVLTNLGLYASKIFDYFANKKKLRRERSEEVLSELCILSNEFYRKSCYCAEISEGNYPDKERIDSRTVYSPLMYLGVVRNALDDYMKVCSSAKIKVTNKTILADIYELNLISEKLVTYLNENIKIGNKRISMSGFSKYTDDLIVQQEKLNTSIRSYLK
ncbi:hypothetical protein BK011_06800 [Tenericutes bacterium MZ-XQ]|nr:hypothetical protein BK011_06800 [Tenericutes bacterium MZ-XQ]